MRYYTTKTNKPATRTTTFNMTEEALAIVKETVKGLKSLGITITQGEVINDLIATHSSNGEKIYQIDDKAYSVSELCKIAFLAKADGDVKSYRSHNKVKELIDKFNKELERIEAQLYEEAEEQADEELEQEYDELEEEEQEEVTCDMYKEENKDEKLDYIYEDKLYEQEEEIAKEIIKKMDRLKDEIALVIYEVPFEHVSKASVKCADKIQQVIDYFYPTKDTIQLMEALKSFRKYDTNKELCDQQMNYILSDVVGTEPDRFNLQEAYEQIDELIEQGKIKADITFFIKMENTIKESNTKYTSNGVRLL